MREGTEKEREKLLYEKELGKNTQQPPRSSAGKPKNTNKKK
jgi:hypothetical protein